MKPENSQEEFEAFATGAGVTIARLKPKEALRLMMDFYCQRRAQGCQEVDGDTLRCRWSQDGNGDGGKPQFQFEIIRQFVQAGDEDEDGMSELNLTCRFASPVELEHAGGGEHACTSRDQLPAFERDVTADAAYRAIEERTPDLVMLHWINV